MGLIPRSTERISS